jgi:hypothetical protein
MPAAREHEMKMASFRNVLCWYQGMLWTLKIKEFRVNLPWLCEDAQQE